MCVQTLRNDRSEGSMETLSEAVVSVLFCRGLCVLVVMSRISAASTVTDQSPAQMMKMMMMMWAELLRVIAGVLVVRRAGGGGGGGRGGEVHP